MRGVRTFHRRASLKGLALAALSALLPASARSAAAPSRIVAVGDLHGDFAAWRAIVMAAGLVDAQGRWRGGSAVLVQMGDAVDRGPDSRRIVYDLMRLQREARGAGGRVVALVGNHEAMNMTGDLRYVSAADFAAYATPGSAALRERAYAAYRMAIEASYRKRDPTLSADAVREAWFKATPLGWLEHQAEWKPDGAIGRWVIGNPAVVLMDGVIFVHGGVGAAYGGVPIAEINSRVAKALLAQETARTSIINDPDGPLWYRGLVLRARAGGDPVTATPTSDPEGWAAIEQELTGVLQGYGAQRMVIAHTPVLEGIAMLHDGRLIRVDTGISAYYGGALSYLELAGGTATPHVVPRPAGGSR